MARRSRQNRKRKKQKACDVTSPPSPQETRNAPTVTVSPTPPTLPTLPTLPAVTPPTYTPTAPLSTSPAKESLRQMFVAWIAAKLRKSPAPASAKLQPASERLKLWMVGTLHWTALIAVIAAGMFCMYLLATPDISLRIKVAALALLGYIVRQFVVFLTRLSL